MSTLTGNSIVDAMATMRLTGNVIPQTWYKTIKRDSGKPDLLAIVILAEIAYWYRPTEVRDECTGQLLGYKKKIKADLFQRNYDDFADMLGETKRAITEAIIRLEKIGVIKRVFRTVKVDGVYQSNKLFLELFPDKLYEITYPNDKKCDSYNDNLGHPTLKNVIPAAQNREMTHRNMGDDSRKCGRRNTKNIKETTTEIISSSSISPPKDEDDDFKMQIDYQNAYERYGDTAKVIHNELCKGDNRDIAVTVTKQIFEELCKSISEYASPIRNLSAYIRVCLSNMATGQKIKRKCSFNQHMTRDDVSDWEDFEKSILAN